jgi:8-oxo-dGTP diphosphatase
MTEFELPNISVDVVPVTLNPFSGKLEVILGKRIFEPNLGELALPGVLLTPHERLDEAAYRALEKKLDLPKSSVTELIDLGTFDNPDRDPRGATVSIAKLAVISSFPLDDFAGNVGSVPIEEIANDSFALPFDHNSIVLAASKLLAEKMLFNKAITKAVLGDTFTTKTLRNILIQLEETNDEESIIYDASNLTRQLKGTKWVAMVEDKETVTSLTASTSRGRPSRVWTWL